MQEKLVIYLHANDLEHPSWAVIDATGAVRQSEMHDNAQGFSEIAEDKEVIVIVPAEDTLLTTVTLPKMSRSRLLQALPFALEEQLVDDVDSLHFAPGLYQANQPLAIAIVSQEKMHAWLTLLKSWAVQPDLLTPAMFAVPHTAQSWHVILREIAIVRLQAMQGFACDKNNLAALLSLALSEATEVPVSIHIEHYGEGEESIAFDSPVEIKEHMSQPQHFMSDLARNVAKTPGINLLQGRFATKKSKFPRRDKLLKAAAVLGVAWVFLLFLYPTVSYFILKQRTNALDTQIAAIYKRNFPHATSQVAPKLRMQEKLQKLSTQSGQNRLFLLLGYIGKAMANGEAVQLKHFDFQNNQLTLELTANTSEDFSTFTNFLTKQGLKVKQQNANLTGSHINATLQIE